jgi:hypothetical protein
MTLNPIKLGFTPEEFSAYISKVNPTKFTNNGAAIQGLVLHNTFNPTLERVKGYLDSKKWSPEQLIDNWWVSYRNAGWSAGPHIFIFPHKIYVATPLNHNGTHSPSYNKSYWGMEIVGDYSHEILPDEMRQLAIHVASAMYKTLGKKASNENFHFHGEDPKTTHKNCPGKNVGPKAQWILDINSDIQNEKHK